MCGIAGIVGPRAVDHQTAVSSMCEAMRHRGPDGEGLWLAPSRQCVLGHTRLAILDLSPAAAQPMLTGEGRFALSYNGECYNFPALRTALVSGGHCFASTGDTEVVLRWLASRGVAGLAEMNGMFALALWDDQRRSLLLARDRFGQKPLYFAQVDGHLLFASEVRALLASGLVARRADPRGIVSYLYQGCVEGPNTVVQGIRLLPRSSCAIVRADAEPNIQRYWEFPRQKQPLDREELRSRFVEAVSRHLVSDVPIGLFLSGGIDSSAVAAAARFAQQPVRTLAVVFPDHPQYNEARFARLVAQRTGSDHIEVPVSGSEMLSLLDGGLAAMDQPTVDGLNTYVVSAAAKRAGLTVALSGLGGDELFGGYPSFRDAALWPRRLMRQGMVSGPLRFLLGLADPYNRKTAKFLDLLEVPPGPVPFCLARRRLFTHRQVQRIAPGLPTEGPLSGIAAERLEQLTRDVADRPLADAIGLLEMDLYMGEMLLRDSDVMGMAHQLEIRVPFLDGEFSASVLGLDAEARVPHRIPKHRLVEAMGDWLPEDVWRRTKQGFLMPFAAWMQGDLRPRVIEGFQRLAEPQGAFDSDGIAHLRDGFFSAPERVGWARPWALFVLSSYLSQNRLGLQ